MTTYVRFWPIEEKDIPDCAEVFVEVFGNEPWNEEWHIADAKARLEEMYHTPGAYGVVAIEDDKAFGFAMGYTEQWRRGKKHFYLKEMCVLPGHQRSGIGTGIMQTLCNDLGKNGRRGDLPADGARGAGASLLRETRIRRQSQDDYDGQIPVEEKAHGN